MIESREHTHRFRYPAPSFTEDYITGICECGQTQRGRAWAQADSYDNGWATYLRSKRKVSER